MDDLVGGLQLPLVHVDLWLLLQVGDVGRAHLSLHLGVLRQLQLFKALKLWDPMHTHTHDNCLCKVDPQVDALNLIWNISQLIQQRKRRWHHSFGTLWIIHLTDSLILKNILNQVHMSTLWTNNPHIVCVSDLNCICHGKPEWAFSTDLWLMKYWKTRGNSYSSSLTRRKSSCSTTAPDIRVWQVDEERNDTSMIYKMSILFIYKP